MEEGANNQHSEDLLEQYGQSEKSDEWSYYRHKKNTKQN